VKRSDFGLSLHSLFTHCNDAFTGIENVTEYFKKLTLFIDLHLTNCKVDRF